MLTHEQPSTRARSRKQWIVALMLSMQYQSPLLTERDSAGSRSPERRESPESRRCHLGKRELVLDIWIGFDELSDLVHQQNAGLQCDR